jgi:phosphoglycolate phosphatase-like HAD superfamily hydrolase
MKSFKFNLSVVYLFIGTLLLAENDPLPSWNDGTAKRAIIDFVTMTTDKDSPNFVPMESRIATFDQDGTLWVEHPIYAQLVYCVDRLSIIAASQPELRDAEPFKTILKEGISAIPKLSRADLESLAIVTLTGMSAEDFQNDIHKWLEHARDPRWDRPFTELIYKPMMEVLTYMRGHGYRTYIVTGGGQDFVRVFAENTYGIPPEQVIGSATGIKYTYDKEGHPFLAKEPSLILNDNYAGKPEGIHLMIGRRPYAAFGNSIGDREMLEYTTAGSLPRLAMLVLHDDAEREYAYGPAEGLPDTSVGTFPQSLYREAKDKGWIIISMKNDWNTIFKERIQSVTDRPSLPSKAK